MFRTTNPSRTNPRRKENLSISDIRVRLRWPLCQRLMAGKTVKKNRWNFTLWIIIKVNKMLGQGECRWQVTYEKIPDASFLEAWLLSTTQTNVDFIHLAFMYSITVLYTVLIYVCGLVGNLILYIIWVMVAHVEYFKGMVWLYELQALSSKKGRIFK